MRQGNVTKTGYRVVSTYKSTAETLDMNTIPFYEMYIYQGTHLYTPESNGGSIQDNSIGHPAVWFLPSLNNVEEGHRIDVLVDTRNQDEGVYDPAYPSTRWPRIWIAPQYGETIRKGGGSWEILGNKGTVNLHSSSQSAFHMHPGDCIRFQKIIYQGTPMWYFTLVRLIGSAYPS